MSYRILNNKTLIDFNNLKVFGFKRSNLMYNYYDPMNIRYLYSKKYGKFIMPRTQTYREINYLIYQNKQAEQFSKIFSNKESLKATITSNFPKLDLTDELQDFNIFLIRGNKNYLKNQIKFKVDMKYSKPEIVQILNKLYGINVRKITTAILPGKVTTVKEDGITKRQYVRTKDKKVAVVTLDFSVKQTDKRIVESYSFLKSKKKMNSGEKKRFEKELVKPFSRTRREHKEIFNIKNIKNAINTELKLAPPETNKHLGYFMPQESRGLLTLKGIKKIEDISKYLNREKNANI